ncbi:MAG: hypothetical protein ABIG89_02345, partial [Candidatus Woesearchaeota archaeon]
IRNAADSAYVRIAKGVVGVALIASLIIPALAPAVAEAQAPPQGSDVETADLIAPESDESIIEEIESTESDSKHNIPLSDAHKYHRRYDVEDINAFRENSIGPDEANALLDEYGLDESTGKYRFSGSIVRHFALNEPIISPAVARAYDKIFGGDEVLDLFNAGILPDEANARAEEFEFEHYLDKYIISQSIINGIPAEYANRFARLKQLKQGRFFLMDIIIKSFDLGLDVDQLVEFYNVYDGSFDKMTPEKAADYISRGISPETALALEEGDVNEVFGFIIPTWMLWGFGALSVIGLSAFGYKNARRALAGEPSAAAFFTGLGTTAVLGTIAGVFGAPALIASASALFVGGLIAMPLINRFFDNRIKKRLTSRSTVKSTVDNLDYISGNGKLTQTNEFNDELLAIMRDDEYNIETRIKAAGLISTEDDKSISDEDKKRINEEREAFLNQEFEFALVGETDIGLNRVVLVLIQLLRIPTETAFNTVIHHAFTKLLSKSYSIYQLLDNIGKRASEDSSRFNLLLQRLDDTDSIQSISPISLITSSMNKNKLSREDRLRLIEKLSKLYFHYQDDFDRPNLSEQMILLNTMLIIDPELTLKFAMDQFDEMKSRPTEKNKSLINELFIPWISELYFSFYHNKIKIQDSSKARLLNIVREIIDSTKPADELEKLLGIHYHTAGHFSEEYLRQVYVQQDSKKGKQAVLGHVIEYYDKQSWSQKFIEDRLVDSGAVEYNDNEYSTLGKYLRKKRNTFDTSKAKALALRLLDSENEKERELGLIVANKYIEKVKFKQFSTRKSFGKAVIKKVMESIEKYGLEVKKAENNLGRSYESNLRSLLVGFINTFNKKTEKEELYNLILSYKDSLLPNLRALVTMSVIASFAFSANPDKSSAELLKDMLVKEKDEKVKRIIITELVLAQSNIINEPYLITLVKQASYPEYKYIDDKGSQRNYIHDLIEEYELTDTDNNKFNWILSNLNQDLLETFDDATKLVLYQKLMKYPVYGNDFKELISFFIGNRLSKSSDIAESPEIKKLILKYLLRSDVLSMFSYFQQIGKLVDYRKKLLPILYKNIISQKTGEKTDDELARLSTQLSIRLLPFIYRGEATITDNFFTPLYQSEVDQLNPLAQKYYRVLMYVQSSVSPSHQIYRDEVLSYTQSEDEELAYEAAMAIQLAEGETNLPHFPEKTTLDVLIETNRPDDQHIVITQLATEYKHGYNAYLLAIIKDENALRNNRIAAIKALVANDEVAKELSSLLISLAPKKYDKAAKEDEKEFTKNNALVNSILNYLDDNSDKYDAELIKDAILTHGILAGFADNKVLTSLISKNPQLFAQELADKLHGDDVHTAAIILLPLIPHDTLISVLGRDNYNAMMNRFDELLDIHEYKDQIIETIFRIEKSRSTDNQDIKYAINKLKERLKTGRNEKIKLLLVKRIFSYKVTSNEMVDEFKEDILEIGKDKTASNEVRLYIISEISTLLEPKQAVKYLREIIDAAVSSSGLTISHSGLTISPSDIDVIISRAVGKLVECANKDYQKGTITYLWGIYQRVAAENNKKLQAEIADNLAKIPSKYLSSELGINIKLARYLKTASEVHSHDARFKRLLDPEFKAGIDEISYQLTREVTSHPAERRMEEDEKTWLFDILFGQKDISGAKAVFDTYFRNDPNLHRIQLSQLIELFQYINIADIEKLIMLVREDPKRSVEEIMNVIKTEITHLSQTEQQFIIRKLRWIIENSFLIEQKLRDLELLTNSDVEKEKIIENMLKIYLILISAARTRGIVIENVLAKANELMNRPENPLTLQQILKGDLSNEDEAVRELFTADTLKLLKQADKEGILVILLYYSRVGKLDEIDGSYGLRNKADVLMSINSQNKLISDLAKNPENAISILREQVGYYKSVEKQIGDDNYKNLIDSINALVSEKKLPVKIAKITELLKKYGLYKEFETDDALQRLSRFDGLIKKIQTNSLISVLSNLDNAKTFSQIQSIAKKSSQSIVDLIKIKLNSVALNEVPDLLVEVLINLDRLDKEEQTGLKSVVDNNFDLLQNYEKRKVVLAVSLYLTESKKQIIGLLKKIIADEIIADEGTELIEPQSELIRFVVENKIFFRRSNALAQLISTEDLNEDQKINMLRAFFKGDKIPAIIKKNKLTGDIAENIRLLLEKISEEMSDADTDLSDYSAVSTLPASAEQSKYQIPHLFYQHMLELTKVDSAIVDEIDRATADKITTEEADVSIKEDFDTETIELFRKLITSNGVRGSADIKNILHEQFLTFKSSSYPGKNILFKAIMAYLASKYDFNRLHEDSETALRAANELNDLMEKFYEIGAQYKKVLDKSLRSADGKVLPISIIIEKQAKELIDDLVDKKIVDTDKLKQFRLVLSRITLSSLLSLFKSKIDIGDEDEVLELLGDYSVTPAARRLDSSDRDIFKQLEIYLSKKTDIQFFQNLFDALMTEARGEFSEWKYKGKDYTKVIDAIIALELAKLTEEEQQMFEKAEGMTPSEKLENMFKPQIKVEQSDDDNTNEEEEEKEEAPINLEIFRPIKENIDKIKKGWQAGHIYKVSLPDGEYTAEFTDDFFTLFNIGNSQYFGSCQNCISGGYNSGLLGYVVNGANKAVLIRNKEGEVVTRRIVRLRMFKSEDGTTRPVIFVERGSYGNKGADKLLNVLSIVSKETGLPVVTTGGSEKGKIILYQGRSTFDYSDNYGGGLAGGGAGLYEQTTPEMETAELYLDTTPVPIRSVEEIEKINGLVKFTPSSTSCQSGSTLCTVVFEVKRAVGETDAEYVARQNSLRADVERNVEQIVAEYLSDEAS